MILRIWRGAVHSTRVAEYVAYINRTGLREYLETPGNRGAQMVTRDLSDGTTEALTMSRWDTPDSIRSFAGDEAEQAKYYPEDEEFLVAHDDIVRHYTVADDSPITAP